MTSLSPHPVREYRCHNCNRRVNRYTEQSIETGWSGDPENDDSCCYCWPSGKLRDAMYAAWERGA